MTKAAAISPEDRVVELEREVTRSPRDAGARIRLGQALLELGRTEDAASQLQLAARLEPMTPDVAFIACGALVEVGRERDAALLLSSHVHRQAAFPRISEDEAQLIVALLAHESSFVRCHTAKAVGRLGLVQVVEALERRVCDEDAAVRYSALASLKRFAAH